MEKKVIKRSGESVPFDIQKIVNAIVGAYSDINQEIDVDVINHIKKNVQKYFKDKDNIPVEEIQDYVENILFKFEPNVAKQYIRYRADHKRIRDFVAEKKEYIHKFAKSDNTANATVDDNSNVATHNIANLNTEIHKPDNILVSRGMIMSKLKELYPDFDEKQYLNDLQGHIIYKHDESSFAGAIAPYCTSITMYPFLLNGIKDLGGLSAAPKNLDSFCGMYCNLIFAVSSQYAGAVATSEFLLYFTYFAKKEWGNDFYIDPDKVISIGCTKEKTIRSQIRQYFQQVVYTINQPSGLRGFQSAFVNFSYFDKPFFDGMFENFYFPDGTQPDWESLNWIQKEFMMWFNEERLKTILTFPVESVTLLYKDGKFEDEDMYNFVCEEYARGHSFFTYISDSVDSLSSCCFNGDEVIKVYDKKHNLYYTTIEDFVNANDSNIDPNGTSIMKDEYYIDSYDYNDKKPEITKITGTLKKNYTGKMYKIYTDENNYIEVTADHIIKVIDKDKNILSIPAEVVAKDPDNYELVVE